MGYALSFKYLDTYKLAREISFEIFKVSKSFHVEERYSLTDQIRRSSRSAGAQIAESWGKRPYEKNFVSKLSEADSEQFETQHWLEIALECEYISVKHFQELIAKCESLGRMINKLIQKANRFCKQPENNH